MFYFLNSTTNFIHDDVLFKKKIHSLEKYPSTFSLSFHLSNKEICIVYSCVTIPAACCFTPEDKITSQISVSPPRNHITPYNEMSYEAEEEQHVLNRELV